MQNKYQSEIAAAVYEDMRDMFKLGVIDKQTMRTFDELCLVPVQPMTAEEIRTLREREGLSQPVLACYLNVSKNLISDWERGVRKPGGAALKLLNLVKSKGVQAISL